MAVRHGLAPRGHVQQVGFQRIALQQMLHLRLLARLVQSIVEVSGQYHRAPQREGRHRLTQHQRGGDQSHHRHQVDVGAGSDRPQPPHGKAPGDKAQGGGPQPQIEQVEQVNRLRQSPEPGPEAQHRQDGQQEQQAPGKGTAGGLHHRVAEGGEPAGQQGVG